MTINYTLTTLKRELIQAFAVLDEWFDKDDDFFDFKPPDAKSAREIFDHVLYFSNAMMSVIDQGGELARRLAITNRERGVQSHYHTSDLITEDGYFDDLIDAIIANRLQNEICRSLPEIRSELRDQLDRCLCHLELLKNGEGILFKTEFDTHRRKTVNLYQCMRLLSLHLRGYVTLLSGVEEEFNATV